ncbi:spore cortex biosynthesis protein YabQ [Gottfriedia luciferensis]|uniref:spore cortex biosynthesis protein YabQ n=1 Tax=Gottfriedia luciferensis TaxID=178774 RepID=UPI000B454E7F|nr:spore cortex biosynthesis protein YabQ [Gottfriedia luciferensis]
MSLNVQFYSMIAMVGMGAYLGMALDTYHRFLNRGIRNRLIVFATDILFWIFQALLVFYVLYLVNEGALRFYLLLALLCGYAAYQSLIQSIYKKILEFVIQLIIRLYRIVVTLIVTFLVKPIKWIIQVIIVLILFIYGVLIRLIRLLYNVVLSILLFFGRVCWFFVPKQVKNYLIQFKGVFGKFKNIFLTTIKKVKDLLDRRKK